MFSVLFFKQLISSNKDLAAMFKRNIYRLIFMYKQMAINSAYKIKKRVEKITTRFPSILC